MFLALFVFWRARTGVVPTGPASRLITGGPYRLSRNPMYLGLTVAYIGGVLLTDIAWTLLTLALVLAGIHLFVIRREERYLAEAFGERYSEYRSRVRRWV